MFEVLAVVFACVVGALLLGGAFAVLLWQTFKLLCESERPFARSLGQYLGFRPCGDSK